MSSTIFSGDKIKALLPALGLGDAATIRSGSIDPQTIPTAGNRGDLYIRTGINATIYQKVTTDATDTNWKLIPSSFASFDPNAVVVTDSLGNLKTDPEFLYDSSTNALNVPTVLTDSVQKATPGILAIGNDGNSTTINIGATGSTINILGDTIYENVTDLNVADRQITVNSGGGVGTATNSGVAIEEGGVITGYLISSGDRNSILLKAPNTAGDATITPGAGITLNQSSHNPVTLGTANGLSLSTQQVSLGLSSTSTTGALNSTDWNVFNNKQTAGNYITALTGDVSATGPGSVAATVNSVGGSSAANINSAELLANAATSLNTPNTIIKRDGSGNFVAGTMTGDITGTAANVTGIVTIVHGGTNSNVALNNNRIIQSTGGAIVEAPAITAARALVSDSNGIPIASSVTTTELGYVSGVTSAIQTQLNTKVSTVAGDISPTSFSLANNQGSFVDVTGLLFSTIVTRAAEVSYSITFRASQDLFEHGKFSVVQKNGSWTIARVFDGDDTLVDFNITNGGQIQYTTSNYAGFVSGTLKYRGLNLEV